MKNTGCSFIVSVLAWLLEYARLFSASSHARCPELFIPANWSSPAVSTPVCPGTPQTHTRITLPCAEGVHEGGRSGGEGGGSIVGDEGVHEGASERGGAACPHAEPLQELLRREPHGDYPHRPLHADTLEMPPGEFYEKSPRTIRDFPYDTRYSPRGTHTHSTQDAPPHTFTTLRITL